MCFSESNKQQVRAVAIYRRLTKTKKERQKLIGVEEKTHLKKKRGKALSLCLSVSLFYVVVLSEDKRQKKRKR